MVAGTKYDFSTALHYKAKEGFYEAGLQLIMQMYIQLRWSFEGIFNLLITSKPRAFLHKKNPLHNSVEPILDRTVF